MRVLLTTDAVGGVWTFTRELTAGLLSRGETVCLLCFGPEPSLSQMADVHSLTDLAPAHFSFQSCTAPLEWMDGNDLTWEQGSAFLESLLEVFRPDVVHANQFCWGMLGGGRPTLVTAHSDCLSWAESTLPGGLPEMEGTADAEWFARYRKLVGEGLAWADAVVAPTRWMGETLQRLYGLEREPTVIANGRTLSRAPEDVFRRVQAVTAGRFWDKAKGLDILAEIEPPISILLAGEARFGGTEVALPRGVQALGRLGQAELQETLRGSAIYIAPSLYEPFGLAPLEAALCGCALLLRDIPTFRELWDGAAVFFHDAESLQAQLAALAGDAALLRRMQEAAQDRAAQYPAQATTAAYLREYSRLLERFGGYGDAAANEGYAA